jgi:ABC-2 type transport system permease protein
MTAIAAAPAPAHRGASGYRFSQVARMEWIKLASQRYPKWILAATVAEMAGVAALAGRNMTAHPGAGFDVINNAMAGLVLSQLIVGVLGVLVMTSEYSSGLIRNTLAAVPNRGLVLTAKATVFTAVTLVVGEISAFAAYLATKLSLAHGLSTPGLGQPGVLRAVLLAGVYLALVGLIGLGLGTLIRHSAGAIGALAGVIFVLPLILLALPHQTEHEIGKFLPMVIAENSLTAVLRVSQSLEVWVALGVLCGYAVVLLGAGGWLLARRAA